MTSTPVSLLKRLKTAGPDALDWKLFEELYRPLIQSWIARVEVAMATKMKGKRFGPWMVVSDDPWIGGNSRVWEALAEGTVEPKRAIKLLKDETPKQSRYARFRDEVKFVQSNPSPHILPIIDSFLPDNPTRDDRPWYVMPLAQPFTTLIEDGEARLESVVRAVLPIASTLAALHGAGAAHRDIKPGNILALEGRPVISDFGLVDFPGKEAVSLPEEQIGPALFIAPEHIGRTDEIDARPSDIYSLAKTVWVLAAAAKWPPQGHLAVGDPRLRVSSFCHHAHVHLIDVLLDTCTKTSPDDGAVREGARQLARTP